MKSQPTYDEVVSALSQAAVPVRELEGPGHVAVTPAAGRVVAMAFARGGPNLFWSNPELNNTQLVEHHPEQLVGGFGGDRLWFAPELDYHWDGVPNWDTFANYRVASEADPGHYRFVRADRDMVSLHANIQLPILETGQRVGFEVERTIRMAAPPLTRSDPLMKDIQYVGIETSHAVHFDAGTEMGRIDLWHLLQAPVGSVLVVPLRTAATGQAKRALSYGMPGGWAEKANCIVWRYGGRARAKFGLSAAALTGRTAVLPVLEPGYTCLIVREFAVDENRPYADHPHGVPLADQAFQAWDGFGFGEMEYHSTMLDARQGPRALKESDRLWAFGGSPPAIAALASRLLGLNPAEFS